MEPRPGDRCAALAWQATRVLVGSGSSRVEAKVPWAPMHWPFSSRFPLPSFSAGCFLCVCGSGRRHATTRSSGKSESICWIAAAQWPHEGRYSGGACGQANPRLWLEAAAPADRDRRSCESAIPGAEPAGSRPLRSPRASDLLRLARRGGGATRSRGFRTGVPDGRGPLIVVEGEGS